jgi:dephospho-CoA kinase
MRTIALTGSIGMGKSTTARLFALEGIPIYDADKEVHALYRPSGGGLQALAGVLDQIILEEITNPDKSVNRVALRTCIQKQPDLLKKVESVIHPLLHQKRKEFLQENADAEFVLLDIPLLFENNLQSGFDVVVVVTAPYNVQRQRVLARPGMTQEIFENILSRQTPDSAKRAQADFVIETHHGIDHAHQQVQSVLRALRNET